MAQVKGRTRRQRQSSRVGVLVKPGVCALLAAAIIAIGAVGVTRTGLMSGFEVITDNAAARDAYESDDEVSGEVQLETLPQELYIVHVDGAVEHPGVYELTGSDLRIRDAVDAAGGLLEGADTSGVNLAAPMVDGSKVHIPTFEETAVQSAGASSGAAGSAGNTASLVNINYATADQLCTLSGIGEATAANIIADRERNGPFTCIEDLMRVSGIGERKFERVKDSICV